MTDHDPIPARLRERLTLQIARLLVYRKGEIAQRELKRLDLKDVSELEYDALVEMTAEAGAFVAEEIRVLVADVAREALEGRRPDRPSSRTQDPPIPSQTRGPGGAANAPGRDTDLRGGPMPAAPYPAMPERDPELTEHEQRVADELLADYERPRVRRALAGEYGVLITMLTWLGLWAVALLVFVAVIAVIA